MPFPANTPTVDDLPSLGLQDIAQLPVELLAILQRDIDERIKRDKAAKARLDGALTVRRGLFRGMIVRPPLARRAGPWSSDATSGALSSASAGGSR